MLVKIIKDSFSLLAKEPKLFIPKFFVSFLFSILILALPRMTIAALTSPSVEDLQVVLAYLFLTVIFSFVDIIVNSFFPFFVKDYFDKKSVSFSRAFSSFKERAGVILPAVLSVEAASFAVVFVISGVISAVLFTGNYFLTAVLLCFSFLAIIVIVIVFYFVYPVASLEKNGIVGSIKRSVNLSTSNLLPVSSLALFSFFISAFTFIVSYVATVSEGSLERIVFLVLFVLLRVFVACLATYQYVLNPLLYLEVAGKKKG